jgi:hypothetical protein
MARFPHAKPRRASTDRDDMDETTGENNKLRGGGGNLTSAADSGGGPSALSMTGSGSSAGGGLAVERDRAVSRPRGVRGRRNGMEGKAVYSSSVSRKPSKGGVDFCPKIRKRAESSCH